MSWNKYELIKAGCLLLGYLVAVGAEIFGPEPNSNDSYTSGNEQTSETRRKSRWTKTTIVIIGISFAFLVSLIATHFEYKEKKDDDDAQQLKENRAAAIAKVVVEKEERERKLRWDKEDSLRRVDEARLEHNIKMVGSLDVQVRRENRRNAERFTENITALSNIKTGLAVSIEKGEFLTKTVQRSTYDLQQATLRFRLQWKNGLTPNTTLQGCLDTLLLALKEDKFTATSSYWLGYGQECQSELFSTRRIVISFTRDGQLIAYITTEYLDRKYITYMWSDGDGIIVDFDIALDQIYNYSTREATLDLQMLEASVAHVTLQSLEQTEWKFESAALIQPTPVIRFKSGYEVALAEGAMNQTNEGVGTYTGSKLDGILSRPKAANRGERSNPR